METRDNNTAVIYARVSSNGDRQSTERQVQDLNEYVKYRGFGSCTGVRGILLFVPYPSAIETVAFPTESLGFPQFLDVVSDSAWG